MDEPEQTYARGAPQTQTATATVQPDRRRQALRRRHSKRTDFPNETNKELQPYGATQSQELARNRDPTSGTEIQGANRAPETQSIQATDPKKDEDTGLKLRLDLNLDIEVDLKARIHGDLTLALLVL
ncbi:hypothetical protein BJY01DRAFT_246442 [Aspergillus pseudoustus]|uniref:Uncharacterized protein n=1 Tax=Aspergillus pseudoustus TaxID=1810923 RepID=A0ABR4K800_9EURO